ncbi:MAG: hypothetical protein RIT81_19520 [Deltaproteobacteria bacterium]
MRTQDYSSWSWDEGWPVQRLRLGWALVLFFFFEVLVGQQLPVVMPFLMLGIGLGCLASAVLAIREWKLEAQVALIMNALDRR